LIGQLDDRVAEVQRTTERLVQTIGLLALSNAQFPTQTQEITVADIWQAVHRLRLDDWLGLKQPVPLPRVVMSAELLDDGSGTREG